MKYRALGQTGISVSAISLGCWGMSGAYGTADQHEAEATLHHALDVGINLLDTADVYGDGHNESLLGRVLRDRRSEYVLASKTGFVKPDDGGATISVDQSPKRIHASCEASLRRLQTDVIDLYYLHRVDPRVAIEESVGAVAELVQEGKVRFIGLCEVSSNTLRRAIAVHTIAAVQSEYSLWTRDIEATILPRCEQLSISVVPFSPLGRGFLTGQVDVSTQLAADDWRATNPRFAPHNLRRNQRLLAPITEIATARDCSPAQVALAWVLSRGPQVIPIPGTKQRRHLDENLKALNLELTAAECAALDQAFPMDAAAGARYTDDFARWLDK